MDQDQIKSDYRYLAWGVLAIVILFAGGGFIYWQYFVPEEDKASGLLSSLREATGLEEELVLENPDREDLFTNYTPLKVIAPNNPNIRKTGQTFIARQNGEVSKVVLQSSYGVGRIAHLYIAEGSDPRLITEEKAIAKGNFIPDDVRKVQPFDVPLLEPVELKKDTEYFFWVEVPDNKTEVGIGFLEQDPYVDGKMYSFDRTIGGGGGVIEDEPSWRPRNEYDLIFKFE